MIDPSLIDADRVHSSGSSTRAAGGGAGRPPPRRLLRPGVRRLAVGLALPLLWCLGGVARAECPSGEDQCLPGFVWREAFPGDHVCVSGVSRARAVADNAQAPARTAPGSDLCRPGFVWRDAEPGDKVCTTGTVRADSAQENGLAGQRRDPACLVPRSATSLGLLALNVAGFGGGGDANVPVRWEVRAQRLAASLRRNRLKPDVITLTELHAWLFTPPVRSCGRGFGVGAGDYDQIDILLNELRAALGVTYRVAYLTGDSGTFGDIPCGVFFAQAMLYDPTRLVHVPPPPQLASLRHDGRQGLTGTPHLRRSLPLCARGTRLTPLDTLIDGPPQTDKCARPTPSGPAFTVFGSDTGHVSGSYARFAFASDPSRGIDVFNIHPTSTKEIEELPGILRLIDTHTPPPYAGSMALYPPLLSGDFNDFVNGLDERFPGFAKVASAPDDVIAVAMGLADRFPSQLRARVAQTVILPDRPAGVSCGDPRFLFSDHCGVFIRLDPDGPEAGALRGVFVDGPDQVVSGQTFRLRATASGGSPDLSFVWAPGGSNGPQLEAQGGAAGGTQTWTVSVTDRRTHQSQTASHTVRNLPAPGPAACHAACTSERDKCMAAISRPGAPSARQCLAMFRECQDLCR